MTSSNEMPVLVATKVRPIKLIDLDGLIKMSATNSLLSITAAVLFVSSQITLKSNIPRFD
jgi:hypothetical protein